MTDARLRRCLVGGSGVSGTLKGAGSRNQAGCLGRFQTVVRRHQSSQSLARTIRAGSTRRLTAARCTRVHCMRQPRYRLLAEERLNQAQVIFGYWFTSTVRLSLHAAEDGQRLPVLWLSELRMAHQPGV